MGWAFVRRQKQRRREECTCPFAKAMTSLSPVFEMDCCSRFNVSSTGLCGVRICSVPGCSVPGSSVPGSCVVVSRA